MTLVALTYDDLNVLEAAAGTAFRVYGKTPLGSDEAEFDAALALLSKAGLACADQIDVMDAQEAIDGEMSSRKAAEPQPEVAAEAEYELVADGVHGDDGLPQRVEVICLRATMTSRLFIKPRSNGRWEVDVIIIDHRGDHRNGFPVFVTPNANPIDQAYTVAQRALKEAGFDGLTTYADIAKAAQ